MERDLIAIVSSNGLLLKYIETQTEVICLTAVKENGMAGIALKKNKSAIKYIR